MDGAPTAAHGGGLSALPFHWLLIAAYPVLFLYSQNLGEVTPEVMIVPLLVTLGLASVAMLVLTRFLEVRRSAVIVSGAIVLICLFGPINENLNRFVPQLAFRWGLCLGAGAMVVIVALRLRGGLGTATMVLNVVALVLVLFAVIPIGQQVVGLATPGLDTDAAEPITATGPGTSRDIWWVILDRYGSDASIETLYGIEHNDFGPWLTERGFQLLDQARANYVRTNLSLASTLHMTHLDGLAARMGPDATSYQPIARMLLDHPVGRFLRSQGYRYTQIGSWFPQTRESDIADAMLRPGVSADFTALAWNASVFAQLERILLPGRTGGDGSRQQVAAEWQWARFEELCRQTGHNFVFAHVLLPHPPYVFHADGTVAPEGAGTSYDEQMRYTNSHLRDLVSCLLDRPAADQPIIILQGDEGPYPPRYNRNQPDFDWNTATPTELMAKFSILDAMYLPGLPPDAMPSPGMTSVNTFRYLFNRYFGTDLSLLPDRVYTSPKFEPYDLVDATDRFPAPGASLAPLPAPDAASPAASPQAPSSAPAPTETPPATEPTHQPAPPSSTGASSVATAA